MEKASEQQINFFETRIENIVRKNHPYIQMLKLVDFKGLVRSLESLLNNKLGRPGYRIESGFKGLLLQWLEDLSDRELERYLEENNAAKLFCGFTISEKTPDHSYFCELRRKIGAETLVKLFHKFGDKLKEKGLVSNIFTFVDASHMISRANLWDERDKAIKAGEEKLNNANVRKYAKDKDADYGCKGGDKYWYGYKRHVAVCARNGLITKAEATKASLSDAKGLEYVCPDSGMILADKGYCTKDAQAIMEAKGCHSGAILKNNMKDKNRDKDRFLTKLRSPFEGVFSKMSKKVRYIGVQKTQWQVTMQAFAFNIKRLIKLVSSPHLSFA